MSAALGNQLRKRLQHLYVSFLTKAADELGAPADPNGDRAGRLVPLSPASAQALTRPDGDRG